MTRYISIVGSGQNLARRSRPDSAPGGTADNPAATIVPEIEGIFRISGSELIQNVKKFFAMQRINLSFALFWP
jgi:hypothetical protein